MKHKKLNICILGVLCLMLSCKKFLDINPPKDSLIQENITQNDDIATSAVTGIYYNMALTGYASGNPGSLSSLCGLSADEFQSYNSTLNEFYDNQITKANSYINSSLYYSAYQYIFTANAVLEGLALPNQISTPVKSALRGEALFIRAFNYFYLINLFGPVPLQLSSDYRITQVATRKPVSEVYQQILTDLKEAESLLADPYITDERVRPNKAAAQALMARVYLYMENWAQAAQYSSLVIDKTGLYKLVTLEEIFLKNSQEAIWQLVPTAGGNTKEGNLFILASVPTSISLRPDFVLHAFEPNDQRKNSWIQTYINLGETYYYPYKYKIRSSTTITEYSMVIRLAELYLIRAEARAQLNELEGAQEDLDAIRKRAGLGPIKESLETVNQTNILEAIYHERKIELFSEWGHRWFDLKRARTASTILALIKPEWKNTAVFYPIPQTEIDRNKNITQNEGY